MKETPEVVGENVSVFVDELSNHSVRLGGFSMVPVDKYLMAKRSITEKILLSFEDAGIEIPFNQLDVHLINE